MKKLKKFRGEDFKKSLKISKKVQERENVMAKNRIWRKIMLMGNLFLLAVIILTGCTAQPVAAENFSYEGEEAVEIFRSAKWTDKENFKGNLCIKVNIKELAEENKADNNAEENIEIEQNVHTHKIELLLSEYFQPETEFKIPDKGMSEEIPVVTKDGRETTITRFVWKIDSEEIEKEWNIPIRLREEYRFPLEEKSFPVCQDTTDPVLEIPAAKQDFSIELKQCEENVKPGERVHCELLLCNTGQIPLYELTLEAEVNNSEVQAIWEKEPKLEPQDTNAVLSGLMEGERKTLSFYVDTDSKQNENIIVTVTVKSKDSVLPEKKEKLSLKLQPAKASFIVNKTADCKTAFPGDTVMYQISIHNTGEVTLHSVITTERFGMAGVDAVFLEQEGIVLNETKTQAKIPQIVPGGCVNLKARVILPEKLENQELINQVIVATDETGEEKSVKKESVIKVEQKNTAPTPSIPVNKSEDGEENRNNSQAENTMYPAANSDTSWEKSRSGGEIYKEKNGKDTPKTGDRAYKKEFEFLTACSFFVSAVISFRMFLRKKDRGKD